MVICVPRLKQDLGAVLVTRIVTSKPVVSVDSPGLGCVPEPDDSTGSEPEIQEDVL